VAIAATLAAEGVAVAVNGRNQARTEQTVRKIEERGGRAVAAVGDLTTDAGAEQVAEIAVRALGGIDILVNNAGGALRDDNPEWVDITPQDYFDSLNINFVAGVRLARILAPAMVERGWGRIINISSTAGRQSLGAMHDYGPAKAAIENFSLNLSRNLSPKGVTVNTIAPGMILTEGSTSFLETLRDQLGWEDDLDVMQRRYATEVFPQTIPRLGKPSEIGAAVAFLASPISDYTTGALLRVDGGTSKAL
jgi:NAD(P)-dependent dehydrogenase (short-subunit alcohol dehydrogenase family)